MIIKNTKRLLSVLLTVAIASGIITVAPITSSAVDAEEQNIMNETYQAGGFTSDDSQKIDSDYRYYFEVDSVKEAKEITSEFGIEKDNYELSEELDGKVIVQAELSKAEASQIENSEIVDKVEKNYNVNGCAVNTNEEDLSQWYLNAMNVSETTGAPERTVKVELLDSGVSYVSALENVRHICLEDDEETDNPLFTDANGHGTALAGLIAGNSEDFKGVNPNAELYDVQVLDNNLQAPISKIVEGIYWGIDNDVDVINMSFGTSYNSEILHNAVQEAERAGILMVAAAGNDNEAGVMYPAAYPEVVAVGSTDSDGNYVEEYAVGDEVELCAPGTQIISTGILDGYSTGCGTSLSAAEITGVASRLLEKSGSTADFVRNLLSATGKNISNSDAKLADLGYALENYDEAMQNYEQNPTNTCEFENSSSPDSYYVGGIVTGLWESEDHQNLAKAAGAYAIISNDDLKYIKYAAKYSDSYKSDYSYKYPGDDDDTKGAHGFGTYTVILKACWKCANAFDTNIDNPYGEGHNFTINEKTQMGNTTYNESVRTLVYMRRFIKDTNKESSTKNYFDTRKKQKFAVIGLTLHMLGDIYAHRTLVPNSIAENTRIKYYKTNETLKSTKEFIDSADFLNKAQYLSFYNDADTETLTFENIKKYLKGDEKARRKLNNEKYADNRDFFVIRFDTARSACKKYLKKINDGEDISKINIQSIIKQNTSNDLKILNYKPYFYKLL